MFQGWDYFSDGVVRWKWTRCTGGEYWRLKKIEAIAMEELERRRYMENIRRGKQRPGINRLKCVVVYMLI